MKRTTRGRRGCVGGATPASTKASSSAEATRGTRPVAERPRWTSRGRVPRELRLLDRSSVDSESRLRPSPEPKEPPSPSMPSVEGSVGSSAISEDTLTSVDESPEASLVYADAPAVEVVVKTATARPLRGFGDGPA